MKKFHYYIGIDVSKITLDVTILYECNEKQKTDHFKIANNQKSIAQFVKTNLTNYNSQQMLFCFENTGVYSLPLTYYLSDNKQNYWSVTPMEIKRSRGISRGKNDKIDSRAIARYACTHLHKFRQSKMSSKAIQQLRILFTERDKLKKSIASFSRTSENKDFISDEVLKIVLSTNKKVIDQLNTALKVIEKKMLNVIASEEELALQYKLITDIPGIGMQTAIYLIIVTKGFQAFENWRQMACYAGVAPFPYQSGTSILWKNKVHPFADRKLKSLLNMCAWSNVQHDKEINLYYEKKLAQGKTKMLVINNVRCKLLSRVFAVIKRKTPYVNTHKFVA